MPQSSDFDLIVIGAGTAGITAANFAHGLGARVAIVERARVGGECLYTGCVPSKTLLAVAKTLHAARRSERYGLKVTGERADWGAVQARLREVTRQIGPTSDAAALTASGLTVLRGEARFIGERRLEVIGEDGPRAFTAGGLVVATGSESVVPDITGLRDVPFLTSETLWDLPELPRHLAILGGGPIGCELSQAFVRLGARVSLIEGGPRLLDKEEPEAGNVIHGALVGEGVRVYLSRKLTEVCPAEDGLKLTLDSGAEVAASHLLVATGKRPRTAGLNLAAVGAEVKKNGALKVDAAQRSTCPYLWGAGDVTGAPFFTHGAIERGVVAALGTRGPLGRMAAHLRAPVTRPAVTPWVTFTDPEIGHFGLTEAQARKRHGDVTVVDFDLAHLDRAVTEGQGGFVKLVFKPGAFGSPVGLRLLGACVVAPRAGELIQLLALPRLAGFNPARLALAQAAYPTYAEAVRYAVAGLFVESATFGHKRREP